jgi:CheY-like chemotaxis protein
MDKNDDILVFADEDATEIPPLGGDEFWKILVVDDDADVHTATEFALRSCEVLGRPLKLFHASSAREALATLSVESEIAVILLDAIMESEDAGLAAVREIREVLQIRDTRIVLRTGQPGQVPELETISRWDINDYKTKGELTRDRLITTLIAAVRSYDQIRRIEQSRVGLEKVVEASNNLMERRGLGEFAEGVITQIAGLIGVRPEGLVCVGESSDRGSSVCRIVAAAGRYGHLIDRDPAEIDHPFIAAELASCLREKRTRIGRKSLTLFFGANGGTRSFATYVDSSEPLRGVDARLIEVFCSNLSISAETWIWWSVSGAGRTRIPWSGCRI